MYAKINSATVFGIQAFPVDVEIDISPGLPALNIVGLPDNVVRESKERVRAAIKNSELEFPTSRITVNLAPADIRKESSLFDLPIAIGILLATGQIKSDFIDRYIICGELSLDGMVREINGALLVALLAKRENMEGVVCPVENAKEFSVVEGPKTIAVNNLLMAVNYLNGKQEIASFFYDIKNDQSVKTEYDIDFSDVKGQEHAKRALEISAAGNHNVILIGPPGSGKTMLSRRIPTILPEITLEEAMETTKIHSIVGLVPKNSGLIFTRPFRSPHHTISDVALVGGGTVPKPGEISLAHNGILFLDELPEFKSSALEVLRQPLEDKTVSISRASGTITFPANFLLASAMNPCPCGYFGDTKKACTCSGVQIQKYVDKISGPLFDRIDIHIEVPSLSQTHLMSEIKAEKSEVIQQRVNSARKIQLDRFRDEGIHSNSNMNQRLLKKYCRLDDECRNFLKTAIERLGLSARAYDKILKLSRTIADLENSADIKIHHLSEAIGYRSLDRNYWM